MALDNWSSSDTDSVLEEPAQNPFSVVTGFVHPAHEIPHAVCEEFMLKGADIVLRTPDNYLTFAHKLLLTQSSTVFEEMFGTVYPVLDEYSFRGIPIVDITEEHPLIHTLLRFMYPLTISKSRITTGKVLLPLLKAIDKYDCSPVKNILTRSETYLDWNQITIEDPLQAHIAATQHDFPTSFRERAAEKMHNVKFSLYSAEVREALSQGSLSGVHFFDIAQARYGLRDGFPAFQKRKRH
jgi:hypothetical protein